MGCCSKTSKVTTIQDEGERQEDFNGPLDKRSCTDIPFLIFFIAFLGGMGYTGYLGFQTGDPYKFVYGVDSWGNTCNRENKEINNATFSPVDTTGLKYQFRYGGTSLLSLGDSTSTVVCVKECPTANLTDVPDLVDFYNTTGSKLCTYDVESADFVSGSDDSDVCPELPISATVPVLSFCVSEAVLDAGTSMLDTMSSNLDNVAMVVGAVQAQCKNSQGYLTNVINDVKKTWKEIIYLCLIAIGVALIVTLLMRFFAAVIIWLLVICSGLGALAAAGYCWYNWYTYKGLLDKIPAENQLEEDKKRVNQWLIYASIASGVALIWILILLAVRKRIALVVQLFREAGKAIAKMPLILLQPLWTFAAIIMFGGALLVVYAYILSSGDPVVDENGRVEFEKSVLMGILKWYYLLGILWVIQFTYAAQQLIMAGAVAKWYFTRDKSQLGSPILSATGRLIRYHLGTIAIGSFIVAVIQLIRIILFVVQRKLRGEGPKFLKYLFKCVQCCLACLEKIMKYINKNAYIMTAIYGTNFCVSAKKAFALILANVLRVGAINSVGTFCLFLGKCGITAIVVIIGLQFFKDNAELCYLFVPLFFAGVFAFAIAHCFMSVYGMAIDTIFVCFCEDCSRNDGVSSPYFMSKGLMEYVENSAEAMAALEARENAVSGTKRSNQVDW